MGDRKQSQFLKEENDNQDEFHVDTEVPLECKKESRYFDANEIVEETGSSLSPSVLDSEEYDSYQSGEWSWYSALETGVDNETDNSSTFSGSNSQEINSRPAKALHSMEAAPMLHPMDSHLLVGLFQEGGCIETGKDILVELRDILEEWKVCKWLLHQWKLIENEANEQSARTVPMNEVDKIAFQEFLEELRDSHNKDFIEEEYVERCSDIDIRVHELSQQLVGLMSQKK